MGLASEPVISSVQFPMLRLVLLEFLAESGGEWAQQGDTYRAPGEGGRRIEKVMMTTDDLFLCR